MRCHTKLCTPTEKGLKGLQKERFWLFPPQFCFTNPSLHNAGQYSLPFLRNIWEPTKSPTGRVMPVCCCSGFLHEPHTHHLISSHMESIHSLPHSLKLTFSTRRGHAVPVFSQHHSFACNKAVSWRCPCSLQGSSTGWPLKVPCNPNTSMILWKYGKGKFLTAGVLANDKDLYALNFLCIFISSSH